VNIQVTTKVLNDPRWYPFLDVVVSILQQPESRHAFDISQYPLVERSAWLSRATGIRASTAEFIRSSVRATSRDVVSNAITLIIDDSAQEQGEITVGQSIRIHPFGALILLVQPLHLIVEDEMSDGAFVLWMARLLGRDSIIRGYRSGRLMFRHAGGKGQFEKSASALTFGVWPRSNQPILSRRLRAIALLDSDAHFPGHEPNAQYVKEIAPHVAFVHMLQARYIESYVPREYARRRLEKDGEANSVNAYFRMTEAQRCHFPIRGGFRDGASPPQPQDHATFLADTTRDQAERVQFRSVDPNDWPLFAGGFGRRLATVFREPAYRCEPNEPHHLTQAQRTELNGFLTKVIQCL
jgi:hypothetical protein